MALVKCPNCGQDISDKAIKCPNCGANFGYVAKMQFGQSSNTNIYKLVATIILSIGGVASVLPLFVDNVYKPLGVDGCGSLLSVQKTPEFCEAIGVATIGCLTALCMSIYVIVQRTKNKPTSWKYWIISLVIVGFAPFATYHFTKNAFESFCEIYTAKVADVEGYYSWWDDPDDDRMTGMHVTNNGGVIVGARKGIISNIYYDYTTDRLGFEFQNDGQTFYRWFTSDMQTIETPDGRSLYVSKMSDEVASKTFHLF